MATDPSDGAKGARSKSALARAWVQRRQVPDAATPATATRGDARVRYAGLGDRSPAAPAEGDREGGALARRALPMAQVRDPAEATPRRVGWDLDASELGGAREDLSAPRASVGAQLLALLADPRVESLSAVSAARTLGLPRVDVQLALDALERAGELHRVSETAALYFATPERKAELEAAFRSTAHEVGESAALARIDAEQASSALVHYSEDDEPRLPVTAGLLSLFLPGTGQLLNGDVARASLVFAVWSLALLTHLSPIWTFVALYAGAEAFFSAKIRGLERRLAIENDPSRARQQPALTKSPST